MEDIRYRFIIVKRHKTITNIYKAVECWNSHRSAVEALEHYEKIDDDYYYKIDAVLVMDK